MNTSERIREKLGKRIISWQENSNRRVYFSIPKEDIFETAKFLFKELGLRFSTASGTDTPSGIEILYHFRCDKTGTAYSARVNIADKSSPQIDSITPIFSAAEWIEREMWEMLGITFKGHPNLKRLLLADDWPQGEYPLRQRHEP